MLAAKDNQRSGGVKNLSGRVVLVTGAASGLGKAMAERFAAEKAKVVVADVNASGAEAVADEIGGKWIRLDVADPDSAQAAVAFTVEAYGRLDILVNNAGVESARAPVHEATLENWHRVLDINLNGVFHCMKFGLAQMIKQGGGGNVVNISSIAGMVGITGLPSYVAAKSGVANLTRAAAVEYGPHGIRVNSVAPTAVYTPLFQRMAGADADPVSVKGGLKSLSPLVGIAEPEDIAAAVAFLASDDARFISGVVLPVDGAYTAR